MTKKKHSALYRHIETLQGDRPWGAMLDAGTGANSLRWMSELATDRWVAVTGSAREADIAREAAGSAMRAQDQLTVGNWADDQLLAEEVFDTVIADYLVGAIEGFAPYFQPYLFQRLRPHTSGALYVTGLEPYVPTVRPESRAGQVVWEIGRFRDACVLMGEGLPYREYPARWVADHVARSGFSVKSIKHFNIGFKEGFVKAQIRIALHDLERLDDPGLQAALRARGEALQDRALEIIAEEGALRACRNYVIAAEVGDG
ncbi:MAG: class I SAM-dependent methyltransferase [Pseudomonadota bacterium]